MVLYSCTVCKSETSWRYHRLTGDLCDFFLQLCKAFELFAQPQFSLEKICHSCYLSVRKMEEFVRKARYILHDYFISPINFNFTRGILESPNCAPLKEITILLPFASEILYYFFVEQKEDIVCCK